MCWSLLALVQIAAARWLKMYHKASMFVHRLTGFLIFLATFIMAMITYRSNDWEARPGAHPALGTTLVVIMTLLTIGGITASTILERTKWNTVLALRIKHGHGLFGYLVMIIG